MWSQRNIGDEWHPPPGGCGGHTHTAHHPQIQSQRARNDCSTDSCGKRQLAQRTLRPQCGVAQFDLKDVDFARENEGVHESRSHQGWWTCFRARRPFAKNWRGNDENLWCNMVASQSIAPPPAAVHTSSGNDDCDHEDRQIPSPPIHPLCCRRDRPQVDQQSSNPNSPTCVALLLDEQLKICLRAFSVSGGRDLVSLHLGFWDMEDGIAQVGTLSGQLLVNIARCSISKESRRT